MDHVPNWRRSRPDQKIAGGHVTYIIGKDMSFFTINVMGLFAQYNPSDTNHQLFMQLCFFKTVRISFGLYYN
jgi:hypothetical protein